MPRRVHSRWILVLALLAGAVPFVLRGQTGGEVQGAEAAGIAFASADLDFFERKIRPLLAQHCWECHSVKSGKQRGGLLLDSRTAILSGGDSGPAAVAGDPAQSLLISAIRQLPDSAPMPPKGKLSAAEVELLSEWVRRKLPYPEGGTAIQKKEGIDWAQGRKHWAFQPLAEPPLPRGATAGQSRIDAFLQAELEAQQLVPAGRGDARTLLRRAKFDLLGLPPTPEETAEFTAGMQRDPQGAWSALVQRLLASPHYGERWGRYWLDLARYADITEAWRESSGQPWRYRDWVVQAINLDLPYHEFVRRQFAADLLPGAEPSDNAALGFLGLSPVYWKELKLDHELIKQVVADEWEERIDAIGTTYLGLTLACARCHDHKTDPVSTHDYYALAGILSSLREADRPLIDELQAQPALAARSRTREIEPKIKTLSGKKQPSPAEQQQLAALRKELEQLKATPLYDLPLACGVADASLHVLPDGKIGTRLEYRPGVAQNQALQIRGNPARTGEVVPRQFLKVLARNSTAPFQQGSGRLDFANALVTDAAPLLARVCVNRVWQQHFGRGLVATPSNFGHLGAKPSHPALLEDLAARFVANGWSLKWLHREIMQSAAYQRSVYCDPSRQARDPENRFYWRRVPRRLEIEAWRDAILSAAGALDRSIGGPPLDLARVDNQRRTLYGAVRRRELSEILRLHDFPDPVAHSAKREPTITPLQQLFVLNGPFFQQYSRLLVERLQREAPADIPGRVTWLYYLLFQRAAGAEEISAAQQFVNQAGAAHVASGEALRQYVHVLLASNEFLFVD